MNQYVAAGVKSDFETLLKSFTETETVRYERFAAIWCDMRMNLLCAGRQTDREARVLMEECIKVATQFWLPPFTFQARVCGLYLLYGLFCTQPCKQKAKIRVTPDQWTEIMNFMSTVHSQHHLDVEFIFQKLRIMQAFHFVASKTEMHPKNKESDGDAVIQGATFREEEKSDVSEVMSSDILEQMSAIHSQYHNVKCALAGPNSRQPDRSLNVVNPDSILNISKLITKHEEKRRARRFGHSGHSKMAGDSSDQSESDPDSRMKVPESVGTIRSRIRDRAYGQFGRTATKSVSPSKKMGSTSGDSTSPVKKKAKGKAKRKKQKKASIYKTSSTQALSGIPEKSELGVKDLARSRPVLTVNSTSPDDAERTAMLHMPKLADDDAHLTEYSKAKGHSSSEGKQFGSPAKRKRGKAGTDVDVPKKRKKSTEAKKVGHSKKKTKRKADVNKSKKKSAKT